MIVIVSYYYNEPTHIFESKMNYYYFEVDNDYQ